MYPNEFNRLYHVLMHIGRSFCSANQKWGAKVLIFRVVSCINKVSSLWWSPFRLIWTIKVCMRIGFWVHQYLGEDCIWSIFWCLSYSIDQPNRGFEGMIMIFYIYFTNLNNSELLPFSGSLADECKLEQRTNIWTSKNCSRRGNYSSLERDWPCYGPSCGFDCISACGIRWNKTSQLLMQLLFSLHMNAVPTIMSVTLSTTKAVPLDCTPLQALIRWTPLEEGFQLHLV